jgi:hypothetical protein
MKKAQKTPVAKSGKQSNGNQTFDAKIEAQARHLKKLAKEYHIDLGEACQAVLRSEGLADESPAGESATKFREWLETVEVYNDGDFALKMDVELSPMHWMQLAAIASQNNWQFEHALTYVLERGLDNWDLELKRVEKLRNAMQEANEGAKAA